MIDYSSTCLFFFIAVRGNKVVAFSDDYLARSLPRMAHYPLAALVLMSHTGLLKCQPPAEKPSANISPDYSITTLSYLL
ncbi:MAG: hypothetical protein IKQ89_06910, partial [Muribaculaceae bacterium]|nr:hypothetical protein [Muribaculaceae bacterium]